MLNGQADILKFITLSLKLSVKWAEVGLPRDADALHGRTLFTAVIAAVMSTCDSIKTVLSGAVFTLINASTLFASPPASMRLVLFPSLSWKE